MYELLEKAKDQSSATEAAFAAVVRETPFDCRNIVHPLLFCPPVPLGIRYLLVDRRMDGGRHILHAGRATSPHPTLNLARIRQTAATLGANEVHMLPPDLGVVVAIN